MSFIAGRLAAGKEGAYFLQESKNAVARLVQKNKTNPNSSSSSSSSSISPSSNSSSSSSIENGDQSDILPEILRHSLPSKIFQPPADSSLSAGSKWVLHTDPNNVSSVSPDVLNPLRAYVSLPQVTFGPKRWQLPNSENSVLASTANDMRRDKYTPVNPEKLKAAAAGLSQIAKAFAAGTAIVFGGASLVLAVVVSNLELHNSDDIRAKGKDLIQPKFEMLREQLIPFRIWAEDKSRKWHFQRADDIKEKPLIKELSKILGAKTSN